MKFLNQGKFSKTQIFLSTVPFGLPWQLGGKLVTSCPPETLELFVAAGVYISDVPDGVRPDFESKGLRL